MEEKSGIGIVENEILKQYERAGGIHAEAARQVRADLEKESEE